MLPERANRRQIETPTWGEVSRASVVRVASSYWWWCIDH
jgi:hypothetical protein